MSSNFMHLHTHSCFSELDGMTPPEQIVERVARYNQPGLGLTDHGNLSGTVRAYKASKQHNLKFFPGIETYIIDPKYDLSSLDDSGGSQRYHLGILSLNLKGYQGLVKLSTLAYTRPRFNYKPRLLVDDLVEWGQEYGNDIAVTTGCVFGLLEKTLIDEGPEAASGILRMLEQVTPNLYVEVQKHNIPDGANEMPEDELISQTLELADKHGLPVLTTADCHYLDQRQKTAHDLMKQVGYKNDGGDNEFPGDTFHVASTGWMQEKWDDKTWARFEESYTDLLRKNTLTIPQLDTFQASVPEMHLQPDAELRRLCEKALSEYGQSTNQEYLDLLDHELNVIHHTKTDNYFLLVKMCVDYMKSQNVPIEARGSAAGSLVCFLLGITQVDPLIWGTTFERFLSIDRVGQMPDVDIDISDVDRHIILSYLETLEINGQRYKTSQIGTFGKFGQNKDDPNDTGSAFNKYTQYLRYMFIQKYMEEEKRKAEAAGRKFLKGEAEEAAKKAYNYSDEKRVKTLEDVRSFRPKDYASLKEIIEMNSVYQAKGTHAGGVLVSGIDVNIDDFIPLMMIPGQKKDTWVTQYTMKDVEQFGLLKMDWLGQTSLTVMRKCQEFLGRDNPLDFTWIPEDDPSVMAFVKNKNNHPGLFHLEEFPKSIAMKELEPKTTQEFVIWQAYSMPGATDSGAKDIYLRRRNSKKQEDYGYQSQLLKDVFDITNGVMLFQEQVLEVCRGVGMPAEELTSFFKIIKDSGAGATDRNKKRLDEAKPRFTQLALDAGLSQAEINWVWKQMVAMGGYAFNRAHAASYGIRSYRTAYLKHHYPVEYMAALLYCWAGHSGKKTRRNFKTKRTEQITNEEIYRRETERMGIHIFPPRINKSDWNWKIDQISNKKVLREGYLSIKGVGESMAKPIAAGQPYSDIVDFAERSGVTGTKPFLQELNKKGEAPPPSEWKGILKKLYDNHVLDELINE